ncbi:hypothetical protein Vretifemale_19003, partial [Volvox reticuliferus]
MDNEWRDGGRCATQHISAREAPASLCLRPSSDKVYMSGSMPGHPLVPFETSWHLQPQHRPGRQPNDFLGAPAAPSTTTSADVQRPSQLQNIRQSQITQQQQWPRRQVEQKHALPPKWSGAACSEALRGSGDHRCQAGQRSNLRRYSEPAPNLHPQLLPQVVTSNPYGGPCHLDVGRYEAMWANCHGAAAAAVSDVDMSAGGGNHGDGAAAAASGGGMGDECGVGGPSDDSDETMSARPVFLMRPLIASHRICRPGADPGVRVFGNMRSGWECKVSKHQEERE